MIKEANGFGATIDEAKENAIKNLGASDFDDIQFDVISMPKKKVLGLFGGNDAEVRAYIEIPEPKENKKKAKKIILAHNHPKGTKTPSKDDVMTTGRLFNLFATVGVRLVCHYIVADGEVDRIETEMLYNPDYRGY